MFTHTANKTPVLQRKIPGGKGIRLADNRAGHVAQRKVVDKLLQLKKDEQVGNNQSQATSVDVIGANAVQLKTTGVNDVVQLEKNKQIGYTAGGAVGVGLAGAAIGSAIPGIGTLTGGLVGFVAGAIGGYLYSKPTLYPNQQKHNYENELNELREYQKENRFADNAYLKGSIVKYSKSNERKFVGLLQHGGVLYTYDENNQLAIGSGVGPMKHALVAQDKKVKAAGWARPQYSRAQENERIYRDALSKAEHYKHAVSSLKGPALKILRKYQLDFHEIDQIKDEEERNTAQNYVSTSGLLDHYIDQAQKLKHANRDKTGITKANPIQLDNESGHYAPGRSSKDEAFEGWKNAGFKNLTWKSWIKK